MVNELYDVVMLCTDKTIKNIPQYYNFFEKNILKKNLIIIGKKELRLEIEGISKKIIFLDEDTILNTGGGYNGIKRALKERSDDASECRAGWYFQQFLKMAYALICEDSSYLVWDSDTIPTHKVDMYENGLKIFDVKTEYHKPYFDTIQRLFPFLEKSNNYSFISEHMLFDKEIMRELIKKIEENDTLQGDCFWEKIISAISVEDIAESGFSEFETYGTYVEYFHKNEYGIRNWESLREGTIFFRNGIQYNMLDYLSKKYDAISFESHKSHKIMQKFLGYKIFQNLVCIKIFIGIKELLKKMMSHPIQ